MRGGVRGGVWGRQEGEEPLEVSDNYLPGFHEYNAV